MDATRVMDDLRQYISCLESCGQLARISVPTDPVLEIAAITDRVCKSPDGGKGLLFEQPLGSSFSVATNLFGSLQRVCLALNIDHPDQLTARMSALLDSISEPSLSSLDQQISSLPEFRRYAPRIRKTRSDICRTMTPPDLTAFPFLHSWPNDGMASGYQRYITLPLVFTADANGNNVNCGMYRAQLRGPQELAIQWKIGSGAHRHLEEFRCRGEKMPVSIVLGGPPALTLSSMLPLPGVLDECTFAGFLRESPLEMEPCTAVPLHVPCGAEVVIEGYVDPAETTLEGPFGNHTGAYAPAAPAAVMRVTAISRRNDAIIPATIVGPPPMEDCWMAKVWERILFSLVCRIIPGVTGLCFPLEWVFHQSAVISLENSHPGMVRETAHFLWETPWFSAARLLVFIDGKESVSDMNGTAWRCINNCSFSRDFICDNSGSRLALDATGWDISRSLAQDSRIIDLVQSRWHEYGLE
ncbi:UbiD family decarboxylase [Geobacter chapellei]|uniref:UbiD family decarboxylase n=2 Tax=Pelotalea chapellei TaxID=44671 RepID=A0ABS5U4M9_9BACT|nr:UbiD family decarboxylase [Pelotalea chapellei]